MGFDYVIVGAGTAGCVLAARLSEDPSLSVCLLEAGGPASDPDIADPAKWPLLQGTGIDWQFETQPQTGTASRRHAWPRGRVVGGSSALNAMAHVRGHPSDFDGWAAEGCEGWGYADLMPYFIRSENSDRPGSPYHGDGGPIRLMTPDEPHPITGCYMAAAESLGLEPTDEHNGPRMAGPTLNTLTIVAGRRQSTADAYLAPAILCWLLAAGQRFDLVVSNPPYVAESERSRLAPELAHEPEAALSPTRQMALISRMHDLVRDHSQFIVATHSPIIMAYPKARIYLLTEDGIQETAYEDTEHYRVTRDFLMNPERMLRILMED